ncbi:MAG: 3-oxoacyl-(acyl-carrier-protein) synthase [Bacteroidetes bacterium]|uniref:beta-ketoacyl-ACP synthase III n=1 Tax=Chitinophaga TaxID=79328 RepID=UPI0009C73CEC|nr:MULTISPECIES: beta-ketoacyl-ACP synthase III [Chitinophaga]MBP1652605.1 3-oxoacyl-(acyl-carrier-protein) synthase [Bacteroidota bacterium]OMP77184.1 3-oxoacyl-ACP synthase [[Flexibacter] sp. ATCC 35208]WPQ62910.1 beta-ketoacyl-ACP synthase III [Chitinophaga sancti]WPV67363.1 beta-ketoacyl-ACP synthase III [Chitinophaga sp. LS1]
MNKITAAITAVGGYVPDYVLSNKELEKLVDTTDEWIITRTGITERRILKGEGKGTSELCVPVALEICRKRGITPADIDLIIVATVTPDMVFPATANIVADKIGAKNAFGFDIAAACSGFLYALDTGARFIESGRYKKVMVIGADKMSSIIDYTDRTTCIIFGDGGAGVLLEANEEGYGLIDSVLKSDGHGREYLHMKAGGSAKPASIETVTNREHYVYQEGKMVFKYAVANMADAAAEIMDRNNLTSNDIAWLVPHQANKRIIDATAHRMGLPEEKVMMNIQRYGNTTAGTLPLCLWDYEKQLKKGDNLVLAAFGGGFTWGATYLKWAYDTK